MRLILLRHAKSSWKEPFDSDHSRPLNKRGRNDAPKVGAHLNAMGWVPDLVLSSDSARTQETWQRMAPELAPNAPVIFKHQLYHAGLQNIRDALLADGNAANCIIAIGHNPGWEYAASTLSGQHIRMTTCNAALFETPSSTWEHAFSPQGAWHLIDLIRPREL